MYAVPNKTQHKLIAKVRGGISQKLDNFSSSASLAAIGGSSNSNFSASSSLKHNSTSTLEPILGKSPNLPNFDSESNHLPQPVFRSIAQNGPRHRSLSHQQRANKHYITPQHDEMIKYVQQSWKGVERDYKKSVNNFINNIDLNSSSSNHLAPSHMKQKQVYAKKKTATTSTPLLLSGSYHHTSGIKDPSSGRLDSTFQPFDLEAFWSNRILKRLTE